MGKKRAEEKKRKKRNMGRIKIEKKSGGQRGAIDGDGDGDGCFTSAPHE